MYTVQSAIGVRFGLNKRWETITLSRWSVAQLFNSFRIVQLTVLQTGLTTPLYLQLSTLASQYATYSGSVQAMLTANGSTTLSTTTTGLTLNSKKAVYMDAFKAGYIVTPVSSTNVVDTLVDSLSLPNVRLTKTVEAVDYTTFFNYCLVNINGFYHRTDTDGVNGVMVLQAMTSLKLSGQNQIGLWSFTEVGKLGIVPITTDMTDVTVATKPVITLPVDMTSKSVLLVLGGYLVQVDGKALTQVGASSYMIDFSQLGLVDRFYESSNYIDLSSLQLGRGVGNSNQIAIADLTSPTAIAAWLALSQTFFVTIDCAELYSQKLAIKSTGLPQKYQAYQQPRSPMVLELGRHPPYWSTYEDQQWSLTVYDNLIGNKLYYTVPTPATISTSGANMPGMPGHLSSAYLLEIGRDV